MANGELSSRFHHGYRLYELEIYYTAEAVYGDQLAVKTQQCGMASFSIY